MTRPPPKVKSKTKSTKSKPKKPLVKTGLIFVDIGLIAMIISAFMGVIQMMVAGYIYSKSFTYILYTGIGALSTGLILLVIHWIDTAAF